MELRRGEIFDRLLGWSRSISRRAGRQPVGDALSQSITASDLSAAALGDMKRSEGGNRAPVTNSTAASGVADLRPSVGCVFMRDGRFYSPDRCEVMERLQQVGTSAAAKYSLPRGIAVSPPEGG